MSGRIWVVEYKEHSTQKEWRVLVAPETNLARARRAQQSIRHDFPINRVVQYVRQGGAR